MQKHNRRALVPTRQELAELIAIKDPNPPELPKDVVDLLRGLRHEFAWIFDALRRDGLEREADHLGILFELDMYVDSVDELLQKYNYFIGTRPHDY